MHAALVRPSQLSVRMENSQRLLKLPRPLLLPAGKGWVTVWATFAAMVLMIREVTDPDICLFGATTVLLLVGIIKPADAFAGKQISAR